MAGITGVHHVAFTVGDLAVSTAWYTEVIGLVELLAGDGDGVQYRILADPDPDSALIIGLREYAAGSQDRFDELRTGMDHLAIGVASREELDARQRALEERGVEFTPAVETPIGTVVVFRDPDGIQLEYWLAAFVEGPGDWSGAPTICRPGR